MNSTAAAFVLHTARLTVVMARKKIAGVSTAAPAQKPEPKSHIERGRCVFCGKTYKRNVRRGIYVTCPHCGERNPGEAMRSRLAMNGARPAAEKPARPKRAPSARPRAAETAHPDNGERGHKKGGDPAPPPPSKPLKRKPRIASSSSSSTPAPEPKSTPRPPAEPDPPPVVPPSSGSRSWLDRMLYG